jgi:hypothetical protein
MLLLWHPWGLITLSASSIYSTIWCQRLQEFPKFGVGTSEKIVTLPHTIVAELKNFRSHISEDITDPFWCRPIGLLVQRTPPPARLSGDGRLSMSSTTCGVLPWPTWSTRGCHKGWDGKTHKTTTRWRLTHPRYTSTSLSFWPSLLSFGYASAKFVPPIHRQQFHMLARASQSPQVDTVY